MTMERYRKGLNLLVLVCAVLVVNATELKAQFPHSYRTIDGTHNNQNHPRWGSAGVRLRRKTTLYYSDGVSSPAGADRPSAREISNAVAAQSGSIPNQRNASDFFWQWGQFLDHDLVLSEPQTPAEPFDIPVPAGDPFFDPSGTDAKVIPLNRTIYRNARGIRQQVNEITAYIDASMVYGSDPDRALALRTLDGTGQLKVSPGRLLPFNVDGFPNAPDDNNPSFFLAGDVRANEQVGMTAMHTLFVREHNYWAKHFKRQSPHLDGDELYQWARAMVAAEIQVITYKEFLPLLLGRNAMPRYRGYKPNVNASIANVFSTAAFRLGHSMLPTTLLRLKRNGRPIRAGHLPLKDAFFAPQEIIADGIEPILRGLASQVAQFIDNQLVDDVRNFLFGPPGSGGFDLAALNIQRGRDHGLPSYNQVRIDYGLKPVDDFGDISSDPTVQSNLRSVYGDGGVDEIDIWVGGLAEDHVRGALVGRTFYKIIKDQFKRLRDGDRYWYKHYLPRRMVRMVEQETLGSIIRRNTKINRELRRNVFIVPLTASDPHR